MARSNKSKPGSYGAASGGTSALMKGPADYFALGVWNGRCDECFLKCKSDKMYLRWDNARVCWRCLEIRNPQDFVRGVPDGQAPPWTRPDPPPIFVAGNTVAETQQCGSLVMGAQMVGAFLLG